MSDLDDYNISGTTPESATVYNQDDNVGITNPHTVVLDEEDLPEPSSMYPGNYINTLSEEDYARQADSMGSGLFEPKRKNTLSKYQNGEFSYGYEGELNNYTHLYNSYAGVDIVATLVLPNDEPIELGEVQTVSYSTHRENAPVRLLGHSMPVSFLRGGRTVAGSIIFTVFNSYAFYRLKHFQRAIASGLYPIADMLPPFDLVLTFANEYGTFSKMKILGMTIVDEGSTMSVDDLITEGTMNYMARGIEPITGYRLPEDR